MENLNSYMREELKYTFTNINDWLKFAEAKHGALITFNVATIFGIFQIIEKLNEKEQFYKTAFIIVIALLMVSILVSLYSFIPITRPKPDCMSKEDFERKREGLNILFYKDIHNLNYHQVIELMKLNLGENKDVNGFDEKLAIQIVNNARITYQKFRLFHTGGWFTWIGIFGFVFLLVLKYVFKINL